MYYEELIKKQLEQSRLSWGLSRKKWAEKLNSTYPNHFKITEYQVQKFEMGSVIPQAHKYLKIIGNHKDLQKLIS